MQPTTTSRACHYKNNVPATTEMAHRNQPAQAEEGGVHLSLELPIDAVIWQTESDLWGHVGPTDYLKRGAMACIPNEK